MIERRRIPPPTTTAGYLQQLPALILLDRLLTPMLAVAVEGVVAYANPACARMLGHTDTTALIGRSLPALLAGPSQTAPSDCVTALRTAGGAVTDWWHAQGFPVSTVVSASLLMRSTDPLLLISLSDVSEWMWANGARTSTAAGTHPPSINNHAVTPIEG